MSQCQKKCDCELYDNMGDNRSALIKMDLPEYDVNYGGHSFTVYRAIRFIGYVVVLVFLSYSLWRIHVIESTLLARDRFANVSRIIALGHSQALHSRVARSISGAKSLADQNGFEFEKELARGGMLTSKNEKPLPAKNKVGAKQEFDDLVNTLFDTIQRAHNDSDRSHFDRNMKAVFRAWFPVFDSLLPTDITPNNDETARNTRSIADSDLEALEEKQELSRRVRTLMSVDSDESSEEQANNEGQRKIKAQPSKTQSGKKKSGDKDNRQGSDESSEESGKK